MFKIFKALKTFTNTTMTLIEKMFNSAFKIKKDLKVNSKNYKVKVFVWNKADIFLEINW